MTDSAGGRAGASNRTRWAAYLRQFHEQRPGITTDTLGTARHHGLDPYQWALEPLGSPPRLIDIACGDGPIFARTHSPGWLGIDASGAELHRARSRGAHPLTRADATRMPIATGSVPALVCTMALMVIQPLEQLLAEIRRVLTDDGTAVFLVPGRRPLTTRDLLRYTQLMMDLRRTHLDYPNDRALARLPTTCARVGLNLTDDRRRRFDLPLPDDRAAERFIASLYLPGAAPSHCRRAARRAMNWTPATIGVPLRRITLEPTGARPPR